MKKYPVIHRVFLILLLVSILFIGAAGADTLIIHTNDVHGNLDTYTGYDGLAAYIQDAKEAGNNVVILSAGDETQGMFSIGYNEGKSAIDIMNAIGYQAMAVGNHEVDYGWTRTVELADMADFPFLAANIFYEGTRDLIFRDSTIINTPELKIGVFGIATPETKTKSLKMNTDGLEVAGDTELYSIAQKEVEKLKNEGCNFIVCLSHLGTEDGSKPNRSIDLAENVKGINLIIDGHSHTELPEGLKIGDTLIVSTGCNLKNIGVVTISKDGKITPKLISEYTKKDPKISAMISDITTTLNQIFGFKVGTAISDLNGNRNPGVRTEETNFGDLIADSFVWEGTKCGFTPDAAIIHGGAIRTSIPAGDFTMMDIYNVLPSSYELYAAEVSGEMLLNDLEANTGSTPDAEGGFPQVSGITYTINTAEKYVEGEVNRVTIETVGGKPFSIDDVYLLISTDQLLTGGDKYRYMVDAEKIPLLVTYEEALTEYIQEKLGGVVGEEYLLPQGRITIVSNTNLPASPVGLISILAGIAGAAFMLRKGRV